MNFCTRISWLSLVLAGVMATGGAMAQTASLNEEPIVGQDKEKEFSPFLSGGEEETGYIPPRYSAGSGYDQRGVSSSGQFDFNSLMTPGARENRRSLGRDGRRRALSDQFN